MINLLRRSAALCNCHLLQSPLYLDQIQRLTADLDRWLKDCLDFAELVLVARDEVDDVGSS